MKTGKRLQCGNSCTESRYVLADGDTLSVRIYDDGFAWKKKGISPVSLVNPLHTWTQEWTDCYEQFFPKDAE